MEQTAVEFLIKQIINDHNKKALTKSEWMKIFEKAKTMEKEQIIDAWFDGVTNWDSEKEVEDYINETFK